MSLRMDHDHCNNCTLLHKYCFEKNVDQVIYLLKSNIYNINQKDCYHKTPLMKVFRMYRGIEKDIKELKEKIKTLTSILINNGTDLNEQDRNGNTVLHIIAKSLPFVSRSKILMESLPLLV